MNYSFDEIVNRRGTKCFKWDGQKYSFSEEGLLPFWVADSDFKVAPEITSALKQRVDHGVFGYALLDNEYYEASINWYERRNNWKVSQEWIIPSCGVVTSMSFAVKAFTDAGDKILIQTPVYGPFFNVVKRNGRELVENPLRFNGSRFEMDFDDLETKCASGVKMMLLCSPHNPVGRVWEKGELEKVINICSKYNVILLSDEIHSDLIYKGYKHIPAGLFASYSDNIIVCTAASKSFNIPGLQTSNCIISNEKLRDKFQSEMNSCFIPEPNLIGTLATQVAYEQCEQWLDDQIIYLENNRDKLIKFFKSNLPEVKVIRPEGTYLAWLDFRNLGFSNEALMKLLVEKGGIALSNGKSFGDKGEGYMRFNFACPGSMMEEGLTRIKKALDM